MDLVILIRLLSNYLDSPWNHVNFYDPQPLQQGVLQVPYTSHQEPHLSEHAAQKFWLTTQFLVLEEVLNSQSFPTLCNIIMFP